VKDGKSAAIHSIGSAISIASGCRPPSPPQRRRREPLSYDVSERHRCLSDCNRLFSSFWPDMDSRPSDRPALGEVFGASARRRVFGDQEPLAAMVTPRGGALTAQSSPRSRQPGAARGGGCRSPAGSRRRHRRSPLAHTTPAGYGVGSCDNRHTGENRMGIQTAGLPAQRPPAGDMPAGAGKTSSHPTVRPTSPNRMPS
jgi:hypothetical protein